MAEVRLQTLLLALTSDYVVSNRRIKRVRVHFGSLCLGSHLNCYIIIGPGIRENSRDSPLECLAAMTNLVAVCGRSSSSNVDGIEYAYTVKEWNLRLARLEPWRWA